MGTMSIGFHVTKKGFFATFSGQSLHFIVEILYTRTNNLHHRKAGSVMVILRLRVQHILQSGAIICSTLWQSNVYCILQGLVKVLYTLKRIHICV